MLENQTSAQDTEQKYRPGFIDFIRGQEVVGLAIAFILGGAIQKLITDLVTDIVQPVIGLFFGTNTGLNSYHVGALMYGHFLAQLINFLIIAWIVYLIFRRLGLERLDLPKK